MLSKLYKSKKQDGFTIIEVLIVLAIAGLILLIVFLAVPALQRNSRNTQRKNDVSGMLSAINEYVTNNSGSTPTGAAFAAPSISFTGGTSSEAKIGFYTKGICGAAPATGQVCFTAAPTFPVAALAGTAAQDYAVINVGGSCDTATIGKVNQGSARSIAIQYEIEKGAGTFAAQCQDS